MRYLDIYRLTEDVEKGASDKIEGSSEMASKISELKKVKKMKSGNNGN